MMKEFDWLSLRIPYGEPIKFIEDSLHKPMRWLVLVNSLRVIKTSAYDLGLDAEIKQRLNDGRNGAQIFGHGWML